MRQICPASPSEIYSLPPSLTSPSLILRNRPGAWMLLIFQTPAPADTATHCWLEPPVLSHCTTLAPLELFPSAISMNWPVRTLYSRYPAPYFTHLHLWLNRLLISHWMRRTPCSKVSFGISTALPEFKLMRIQVWSRGAELSTGTM